MHKQLAMLHYDEAESEGEAVEQSLGLERRVPVVGPAAETDVRDTRATAGYWRADYAAIAPRRDANGVVTETDPAILFLSANAGFRASQTATDRGDVVRRLDNVVKSYGEVLKAEAGACGTDVEACETRAMDAAFNYEYTIRAREAMVRSRAPAVGKNAAARAALNGGEGDVDLPSGPTLHGRPGRPAAGDRHESIQDRDPEARGGKKGRPRRRQGGAEDSEGVACRSGAGCKVQVQGAGCRVQGARC